MNASKQNPPDGDYSSDDEDDEEDEEKGEEDGNNVDYITGALKSKCKEKEDFDNMPDAEKEKEAEKLMTCIERLNDLGVIKPMSVGSDGQLTDMKTS